MMDGTIEGIQLQIYIVSGVTAGFLLLLFILIGVLFVKINRLSNYRSNQLGSQRNIMGEFCYSNPTIVPGEELSRRGYSMYSGNIPAITPSFSQKNNDYEVYQESQSHF